LLKLTLSVDNVKSGCIFVKEITTKTNTMTTSTVKSEAKWKSQFQIMWNNTPKKSRRTISQVNNIKSQAKLYVSLWM
jgi:hypothetical protein